MRRREFGFDVRALEDWLEDVALLSRKLVDHAVDRVDRLVEDVLRDADEVARRAVDLFDGFLASLDERERRDRPHGSADAGEGRDAGHPRDHGERSAPTG